MPKWKWKIITMDFVSGLPLSPKKKYAIWVIVDWLTKATHFIPVRMDFSFDRLDKLYVSKIVRLHGVLVSIIYNRDPRFTSQFWNKLQEALGTKLNFNTAFHPQTDGQFERVIQILEDMLWYCVLEFEVISPTLKWHHMRLCMVGDVELHCIGQSSARKRYTELI
ncbi:Transposon Ty3-I Gag-Pol polyprotein [Gossypium australe]|uniref:Transposon Ty3-I Gag-Pol polyprotein n=1 Tax=Gossypium australe TaxID=47621 RepID=A0A5B6WIF1_9ROSI|nr:Transposon Ty3-I Gag-Pol polyprotein [Gossypium australe]